MAVAPIPVFGLFVFVGIGVLVGWTAFFGEEAVPSLVFVIVPTVGIVVILIDDDRFGWRRGTGNERRGHRESGGERQSGHMAVWAMHFVVLQ